VQAQKGNTRHTCAPNRVTDGTVVAASCGQMSVPPLLTRISAHAHMRDSSDPSLSHSAQ
jgi:hypothetical protein